MLCEYTLEGGIKKSSKSTYRLKREEYKANRILCVVICEYTLDGGMLNIKQKDLQRGEYKANSILGVVLCEYTLDGDMQNTKQNYLQPEEGRIQNKQHVRCCDL